MGRTGRTSRIVIIIYTVGGHRSHAQESIVQRRRQDIQHYAGEGAAGGCRGGGQSSRPKYVSACAAQQANLEGIPATQRFALPLLSVSCACRGSSSQSPRRTGQVAVRHARCRPATGSSRVQRQIRAGTAALAPSRKFQAPSPGGHCGLTFNEMSGIARYAVLHTRQSCPWNESDCLLRHLDRLGQLIQLGQPHARMMAARIAPAPTLHFTAEKYPEDFSPGPKSIVHVNQLKSRVRSRIGGLYELDNPVRSVQ